MEIFGVGVTLIAQTQLNKAWSKAHGSITSVRGGGGDDTQIFVATEEIPLHIVTANESLHANFWWSIPSS